MWLGRFISLRKLQVKGLSQHEPSVYCAQSLRASPAKQSKRPGIVMLSNLQQPRQTGLAGVAAALAVGLQQRGLLEQCKTSRAISNQQHPCGWVTAFCVLVFTASDAFRHHTSNGKMNARGCGACLFRVCRPDHLTLAAESPANVLCRDCTVESNCLQKVASMAERTAGQVTKSPPC